MTSSIAINTGASSSHTAGPFAGFYDWQDARAPDFSPASSPSSASSLSVSPSSPALLSPPAVSWAQGAAEAHAGIHYVRERFPTDGAACIAPPFAREPLQVDAGERVLVLAEVGEHALRVRRVAGGAVGLVPAWDVEGALERLARINMEINEMTLYHPDSLHSKRFPFVEPDDDAEAEGPAVYDGEAAATIGRAGGIVSARKSVVFAARERPVMFRYPSESMVHAYFGAGDEEAEEDAPVPEEAEAEAEWLWDGWEEQAEGAEEFHDAA